MLAKKKFSDILSPYQLIVEEAIKSRINDFGPQTELRDACEYALINGGKRFRPALVLMIAKALGHGVDALDVALGVEYFHTASLIADDLPCMDNDEERRGKPATHKVYGESVALLATYALIAAGYDCLAKNAAQIKAGGFPFSKESDSLCVLALENAAYNTGILGATGGQFLDLSPETVTLTMLREVLFKKTVTLFEISFVLGWLYGGGDQLKLNIVKKSAEHFGMAFQIADDIGDMEQDEAKGRVANMANFLGKTKALEMFQMEIEQFQKTLNSLNLKSEELNSLVQLMSARVVEAR